MSSERNRTTAFARKSAIVLLFFLGLTALLGAVPMIIDPTGKMLGLPPGILAAVPFESYLFPAILLGVFNGILSLVFAILVIRRSRLQAWLVIFQGFTLAVWLTVEVFMNLFMAQLTITYYVVSLLLLAAGITMLRSRKV